MEHAETLQQQDVGWCIWPCIACNGRGVVKRDRSGSVYPVNVATFDPEPMPVEPCPNCGGSSR